MHDAGSSALVRDVSFIIEAWGFGIGLKILVLGCLVSFRLQTKPRTGPANPDVPRFQIQDPKTLNPDSCGSAGIC